MFTLELAKVQLDACAKYFPGVWYLYHDGMTGYGRTRDRSEAETSVSGILYIAGE